MGEREKREINDETAFVVEKKKKDSNDNSHEVKLCRKVVAWI